MSSDEASSGLLKHPFRVIMRSRLTQVLLESLYTDTMDSPCICQFAAALYDDNDESSRDDADDDGLEMRPKRRSCWTHVPSAKEIEPFETDESVATPPPPPPAYCTTARMSIRAQAPIPFLSEAEVDRILAIPTPPPSTTCYSEPSLTRAIIRLQKAVRSNGIEVRESLAAAAARQPSLEAACTTNYGFVDMMDDAPRHHVPREVGCEPTDSSSRSITALQQEIPLIAEDPEDADTSTAPKEWPMLRTGRTIQRNTNLNDDRSQGSGSVENQVKFATCTLHGIALTWWNTHVKIVGHDAAYGMPWKTLLKMMTVKYCPRNEIKKRMFPEESDVVEKYVGGLPDMIQRNVMSTKPKTMEEAIKMANNLMDQKLCTSSGNANAGNNQRAIGANQKGTGCYKCGAHGHFKRECQKLKNKI
ncbi:reverse transcriptase domain-containing protein [Tanacetum coccineum]